MKSGFNLAMEGPMDAPVKLHRKRAPRFLLEPPIEATFGADPVVIYNIGERGIQVEHARKLPLQHMDTLRFSLPTSPRIIRATGRVVWCRASQKSDPLKSWPYRCGLELEGISALSLETLAKMLELSLARPLRRRPAEVTLPPMVSDQLPRANWVPSPPLTLEQSIALVQSARAEISRLSANDRASLASEGKRSAGKESDADVLTLYEYLRHVLQPPVIRMVIDLSGLEES